MKKKLVICIPSLRLGGAAKIALNLCEYYAENQTDVTVLLTGMSASEQVFKGVPSGVKVIAFPEQSGNRMIRFIRKIFWIAGQLRQIKPEAILAVRHDATVPSSLAWKLSGKPGRFYIREINPISKTLNRHPVMVKLIRAAYAAANGIIANSWDVGESLKKKNWLPANRIYVIDNPVLTRSFFAKAALPLQDPWLNDAEVPLIVTIGRLQKMKAHETLIKAFNIVKKQVNCRLMIIGEGEEHDALENLIQRLDLMSSVRLTGGMENPYPYLKAADLFVLTSVYEGFGNVLVEALSQGKKIVSTNCVGGPAYILNHGEYGTLVPVGQVEALAEAMLANLNADVDPAHLIARAMEFSVDVVGRKYSNVMFEIQ
jgi:glycosyltransferase involved in cell wall biosynthesis